MRERRSIQGYGNAVSHSCECECAFVCADMWVALCCIKVCKHTDVKGGFCERACCFQD